MSPSPSIKVTIGEALVTAGAITREQLELALERKRQQGGFLGDVLVDMGLVKPETVGAILSREIGVKYADLTHVVPEAEALTLIPESYQRRHRVFPYKLVGNTLHVAMSDPANVMVIDDLSTMTGKQVAASLALTSEVQRALDHTYFDRRATDRSAGESGPNRPARLTGAEKGEGGSPDDAPAVRLVNQILSYAVRNSASDIHIEPQEDNVRVRYRLDGMLYNQVSFAMEHHASVLSRIKILSGMNVAERRRPQDGRMPFSSNGETYDVRVSTMQMLHGEKAVLRILDRAGISVSLKQLGFLPKQLDEWETFLARPHGMLLLTGPTGSGKSTTLYASLATINDESRNIITIEDPIEYNLSGVNQVQVNPTIDVTFAAALRHILRQDPDVVMVGEIRDRETAELSVQAALTGHLVFSTLHTNDAPGAIVRLRNMGVESFLLASAINGVVGQRLLRKVCAACATQAFPDPVLIRRLGMDPDQIDKSALRRGTGCKRCVGRGYRGRTAVYEIMSMSDDLRDAVMEGASAANLRHIAISEGMSTIRESAIDKVLSGETTLEEACRVVMEEQLLDRDEDADLPAAA